MTIATGPDPGDEGATSAVANLIGWMPPPPPPVSSGPTAPPAGPRAQSVAALTFGVLADGPVDAVVTTRHGGVSTGPFASLNLGLHVGDQDHMVLENRRRAAGLLSAGLNDLVLAEQVHGAGVAVVGPNEAGRGARDLHDAIHGVDALVTDQPGPVLVVLVADCAPVVLADPEAGVLGCVHAGWRGTVSGILEAALGAMASVGARPQRTVAAIGPTIAQDHYEVGPEVRTALEAHLGSAEPWCRPGRPGRFWFDLAGAVAACLRRAGVVRIETAADTTGPPGPFYSFRAEGVCGRFGLLARLRP